MCAHLRISPQLFEHAQVPELRVVVQVRLPLAGLQRTSPFRHNLPLWMLFFRLAGVPTLCSKCPGSGINLRWRSCTMQML